jgi:hypothetical protein
MRKAESVRATEAPELRIAVSAVRAVLVLAVPFVVGAALVAGPSGLLGAGIGAAVVLGMFVISAALSVLAAPHGPSAMLLATVGGFALRLVLYAILIVVLDPVEAIHGPSLAVTAAALLVGALAWEVRHTSRTPSFWWVQTGEAAPASPVGTERTTA